MTEFHQSRPKLAIQTALFAIWTAIVGFMAFVSAHADGLWPYLGLSLFAPLALAGAVAAAMGALSLWQPATIALDAQGVVFRSWRRDQRIAFDDIAGFIVLPPSGTLRSPACERKSATPKFVSFGRNWEKTPEAIAAALEQARTLPR